MTSPFPIPAWFLVRRSSPSPWHKVALSTEAIERIVAMPEGTRHDWDLVAKFEKAIATELARFDWSQAGGSDLAATFEGYVSVMAGVANCLPAGFEALPWLVCWRPYQSALLAVPEAETSATVNAALASEILALLPPELRTIRGELAPLILPLRAAALVMMGPPAWAELWRRGTKGGARGLGHVGFHFAMLALAVDLEMPEAIARHMNALFKARGQKGYDYLKGLGAYREARQRDEWASEVWGVFARHYASTDPLILLARGADGNLNDAHTAVIRALRDRRNKERTQQRISLSLRETEPLLSLLDDGSNAEREGAEKILEEIIPSPARRQWLLALAERDRLTQKQVAEAAGLTPRGLRKRRDKKRPKRRR